MSDTEEVNERSSLLRRARKDSRLVPRGDISDRKRWWSIRVMYLTMFLSSVTFTLTISSIWPFLRVLDHSATADFLGWVVSAYSLGQLIASPLFGMWANWRGKSREPLVLSITLGVGANMMYAYLQSFDGNKGVLMIAARGLIGFAAGNVAVVRSYVAGATTLKERTAAMANVSIFQSIGFILGPVIQAAFVPLSYPGVIETKGFHLNMYTAPAILGAILCFINVVLIFVVFQEFRVPDEVSVVNVQSSYEQSVDDYKPDYFAVISCILIFFVVLFIFTIFETIATPLSMDMFAWTKEQSTLYIGVLLASCGVEAIGVFVVLKILSRRFNERYLLIGGFVLCFAGYFVQLPWGDGKLILAQSSDTRSENITTPAIIEGTPSWNVQYDTLLYNEPYVRSHQNDVTVMGFFGNSNGISRINDSETTSLKTLTALRKNKILTPFLMSKAARTIKTKTSPVTMGTAKTMTTKTTTTLKTIIKEAVISTAATIPKITDAVISTAETITTPEITDAVISTAETITTPEITDAVISTAETITTPEITDAVISTAETITTPEITDAVISTAETITTPEITDAVISTAETITTPAQTITEDVLSSAGTFITEDVLSSAQTVPTTTQTVTDITVPSAQTLSTLSTTPRTTTEEIMSTFSTNSSTTEEPVGCPSTIPWCYFTPPVYLAQFVIGCIIISAGYPTANVMSYTLFSKILGPKPQGLWMGWLTASGSLARTLGPIFVSQIYYSSGPRVVFAVVCAIVLATILAIIAVFKKLVPCQYTADYQTPPDS